MFSNKVRIQLCAAALLIASITVARAGIPNESVATFDRSRLTRTEQAWLAAHPVIYRAGVTNADYRPIGFYDANGTGQGILFDYLELLEQRLGIRFETRFYDSLPKAIAAVAAGQADLIGGITASAERARQMDLTDPYLTSDAMIVVRSDSRIENESDLRGRRIAIEKDFAIREVLISAIVDLHFIDAQDTVAALQEVQSGQADAYIGNSAVVPYYLSRSGGDELVQRGVIDLSPHYYIFGVRPGATELVSMINRALASITPEETRAIRSRWIPEIAEPLRLQRVLRFAWPYLLGITLAIAVMLTWNHSLRLQMRRRRAAEETAQDSRQQLIAMTNGLPLAVFQQRTGVDGIPRYTFLSEQVVSLFGSTAEALMEDPEHLWRAIHGEDREQARQQVLAADSAHLPLRMQFRVCQASVTRWVDCASTVARKANGIHERNGFWLDVTALKRAQQTAEAATKAKSEFLANMSHEIRTPLNGILGMAHLIAQGVDPAQQRNHAARLQRSAKSLLTIINDILDLSKIEAGKLQVENVPFDLTDVLDHWTGLLGQQAAEKALKLLIVMSPGLPTALVGDPLRLGQILLNLGSNAVKFTAAGEVLLSVEVLSRDAEHVTLRFSVRDTGIGMSEAEMQRLFVPFEQGDGSISRRFGGTGLGLAISRQLAGAIGGQLQVRSTVGSGSEFLFESRWCLDTESNAAAGGADRRHFNGGQGLQSRAAIEGPQQTTRPNSLEGARLLLVEDNEINRELAVELLLSAGARVAEATDAMQALTILESQSFDAVLMDCQLPVMDGYEATRAIRANTRWCNLPIIAMTANAMSGDRDRALAAGMNDHIAKPIDVDAMFKTLRYWVRAPGNQPPVRESNP